MVAAERDARVLQQLPEDARHTISVITVSELLHGVHRAAPDHVGIRRQVVVEALLAAIEQLPITPRIARAHAQIWPELQAKGKSSAHTTCGSRPQRWHMASSLQP